MNWLASPHCAGVVQALIHTLWQAGVIAAVLMVILTQNKNPVIRYRCLLGGMLVVLAAGVVTWAVLDHPIMWSTPSTSYHEILTQEGAALHLNPVATAVNPEAKNSLSLTLPWTAWMALIWMAGAVLMLTRAAIQVAGAERLRRSSCLVTDRRLSELLTEVRGAVGLVRRVELAATDRLTSPAVVGVLVPTLILPLSLMTTLTPAQLRFVLLHELAHVQRGDYMANLFQLLVEALLFFNPAVWWLSRQLRVEREACCDLLAVQLSGAPADYARTLLCVAENVLSPAPCAAAAFGDRREPSSLLDRVQRMLVPGYRPKLRLTWRGMMAGLLGGAGLLVLSAIGTRVVVAAILTPQERMAKIERKMTEYGEKPGLTDRNADNEDRVTVRAKLSTRDGSAIPKSSLAMVHSHSRNGSASYSSTISPDGMITQLVRSGQIWVEATCDGYAPTLAGPFDGFATNAIDAGELVLDRGFEVAMRVRNTDSGAVITNATLHARFVTREAGIYLQRAYVVKADDLGRVTFPHALDQPLLVTANAPGYELIDQRFEHSSPGQVLEVRLKPGGVVVGQAVEKGNGNPIQGAMVRVLHETGPTDAHYEWTDAMRLLGSSDAAGRFTLDQLRRGSKYWLGISAPGRESVVVSNVVAGLNGLVVKLGPELVVKGRVIGSLDGLQIINSDPCLFRTYSEVYEGNSFGKNEWVPLVVTNGFATFVFTNPVSAVVTLSGTGYREAREVSAPIDDWVVRLNPPQKQPAKTVPTREVVFRFKHASGVSPRGTVSVTVPDDLDPKHSTAHNEELEVQGSEVHAQIPIGGRTSIEPKRMVGFWFDPAAGNGRLLSIQVTNGGGPIVVEVPLLQAGAIYARARKADGTTEGGLFFGVIELKPAPGRDSSGSLGAHGDSYSNQSPRNWVSGPLPLGGTYQVYAWRGNSFCTSGRVKLTEANPDAEVDLVFSKTQSFDGVVQGADGKPLPGVQLKVSFALAENRSFGLQTLFADEQGRFGIENLTPELGTYSVEVSAPGMRSEIARLGFRSQPQTIRMVAGRKLGGQIVEASTGYVVPGAEVRAVDLGDSKRPALMTHTDQNGRFEFNSMGEGRYTFYVSDAQLVSDQAFDADGSTNLTLRAKFYEWSQLKAKPPAGAVR